jgi:hypothetical protein
MLVRETECSDGDVIWSWNSVEEARNSGRFDYQFEDEECQLSYDEYNTFSGTLLQFLDKFADKGIFYW